MKRKEVIREKQRQIIQTNIISFGIVMFLLLYYLLIIKQW